MWHFVCITRLQRRSVSFAHFQRQASKWLSQLTFWYSSLALLSNSRMSLGRASATPLGRLGSSFSGDRLWACSASSFTILGKSRWHRVRKCGALITHTVYVRMPKLDRLNLLISWQEAAESCCDFRTRLSESYQWSIKGDALNFTNTF